MSNLLEKRSWLKKKERKKYLASVDSFIAMLVSHRIADYIIWNTFPFIFICKSLILSLHITLLKAHINAQDNCQLIVRNIKDRSELVLYSYICSV